MRKFVCHNHKSCPNGKTQLPMDMAYHCKEDDQIYCSKACSPKHDYSTPKLHSAFVLRFLEGVYEKRMKNFVLEAK